MPVLDKNDIEKVKEYDKFVRESPYGHMMQDRAWAKVKSNWNSDYIYLDDENGKIRAAMSILSISNDGENSFMYAPRGPVCDPEDIETINELVKEAEEIIKKRKGFLLRMDPELKYSEELVGRFQKEGYTVVASHDDPAIGNHSNPPYNMILYFDGMDIEETMATFSPNARNKIRRSYRDDVYTKVFSSEDADFDKSISNLNSLLQIVSEREDIALRNLDYLKKLAYAFDDVKIFETYHPEGDLLAACMIITYNKKSFYIYSGSSNEHRNLNAPLQLNYEAIKYAIEIGSEEYDMGGVFSTNSGKDGLYRFKRGLVRKDDYTRFLGEIDLVLNQELYEDFMK